MSRAKKWFGPMVFVSLVLLTVPIPVWADSDSDSDSDSDQCPPGSISATLSGAFTHAGIDINLDGYAGAFHTQGAGSSDHGPLIWSSLSESNPNFVPNTPRCTGLLDVIWDYNAVTIRFEDGDLLYLRLDPGDVSYGCLDPSTFDVELVWGYSVVGGTGCFEGATGSALGELFGDSVLFDAANRYVFGGGAGTMLIEFD